MSKNNEKSKLLTNTNPMSKNNEKSKLEDLIKKYNRPPIFIPKWMGSCDVDDGISTEEIKRIIQDFEQKGATSIRFEYCELNFYYPRKETPKEYEKRCIFEEVQEKIERQKTENAQFLEIEKEKEMYQTYLQLKERFDPLDIKL